MATSNVPVRVPDRQPETKENAHLRPAIWRPARKPARWIIKVGSVIPS